MFDRYLEKVYTAFQTFFRDVIDAILVPGQSWQILSLGIVFGQGPFQLWEAGLLDALDRLKVNLTSALTEAINEAIIEVGVALVASKPFSTRVLTLQDAVEFFFDYLLVASQSLSLFSPQGLISLVLRLEKTIGSPLRKVLNLVRGERILSLAKTVFGAVALIVVLILRTGGGIAIILLSAKLVDDLTSNPRPLFRRALSQTNPRITIAGCRHRVPFGGVPRGTIEKRIQ